jgi:hypothetical protein
MWCLALAPNTRILLDGMVFEGLCSTGQATTPPDHSPSAHQHSSFHNSRPATRPMNVDASAAYTASQPPPEILQQPHRWGAWWRTDTMAIQGGLVCVSVRARNDENMRVLCQVLCRASAKAAIKIVFVLLSAASPCRRCTLPINSCAHRPSTAGGCTQWLLCAKQGPESADQAQSTKVSSKLARSLWSRKRQAQPRNQGRGAECTRPPAQPSNHRRLAWQSSNHARNNTL